MCYQCHRFSKQVQGHLPLAKVLLEARADPTRKVQEWSPIMLAEREQNKDLVELLKEHIPSGQASEPSVDVTIHQARTLYHAAVHGDEKTVRSMVERGEIDVNCSPGEGGATPLFATCMVGKAGMVQLLLDARASPNQALANGQTPLTAACETGRADVVRLLLENDVDLDGSTNAGTTALMIACHRGERRHAAAAACRVHAPTARRVVIFHKLASAQRAARHPCRTHLALRPSPPARPLGLSHPNPLLLGLVLTALRPLPPYTGHNHLARMLLDAGASTGASTGTARTP